MKQSTFNFAVPATSDLHYSTWREAPQALFLSWPLAMQLAYCAARDLDSAAHALSDGRREFYTKRASSYGQ